MSGMPCGTAGCAWLCAVLVLPAAAQEKPAPPAVECRWAAGPIEIDGKADDAAWKIAQPIDNFGQPWLKENARPPKTTTKARLLWDRDYLYFFADLEDHDLFADIVEHDGRTWLNDVFEILLPPGRDKPRYYEFQVNAAGTMLDIFFPARRELRSSRRRPTANSAGRRPSCAAARSTTAPTATKAGRSKGGFPGATFARTGGRPAVGESWRFALCRYDYTLNEKPGALDLRTALAAQLSPARGLRPAEIRGHGEQRAEAARHPASACR